MQIDKISFKGVYRYGKFTPIQYKISENIKNTLMSDYNADRKGRTPNDILAKKGYDTVLYPNGDDRVDLCVVSGKNKETGVVQDAFKNRTFIGTYNNRSLFSSNDIYNVVNSKSLWKYAFILPATFFLALLAGNTIKKCNKDITKNAVENVMEYNVAKDSVNLVKNDSIKLINK